MIINVNPKTVQKNTKKSRKFLKGILIDVCPDCHRIAIRLVSAPKHVNGGFYDLLKG